MRIKESTITKATVYTHSSAQITRFAEIEITETGEQTIEVPMHATRIEESSIQVKGGGKAVLKDVKLVTNYSSQEQYQNLQPLMEQAKLLMEQQIALEAKMQRIDNEGELLSRISERVFSPEKDEQSLNIAFDPEKWDNTLDFYRSRQAKLDEERFELQKEKVQIEAEAKKINNEIQSLSGSSTKKQLVLAILIEVQEAGTMQFEISYLAKGAQWFPNYDIRVDSEEQTVQVSYQATVKNNTGEDWSDVRLSLSTAKPFVNSKPPKLTTWFLSRYVPPKPRPVKKARATVNSAKTLASMLPPGMSMRDAKVGGAIPELEEAIAEESYMEEEQTTVDAKTSSVLFHIAGTSTIISDNQPQKVNILQEDFKSDFHYIAVPSYSENVYLKAKITNNTAYPLLAGEGSVFMDHHFVAKSTLAYIAPKEHFEIDLGIDENIKIEYKNLERFWTSEGFLSKNKKKISFEYVTIIENKKEREVKLLVMNQIPKSTHQDIQVELIEPAKYNEDNDAIELNSEAILTWTLKVAAGQKLELPLKYSVMYPKEIRTELDN